MGSTSTISMGSTSNKLRMIFDQTTQKLLFRVKAMLQLMEASGVKVIDGSDKMALTVEATVPRPSDRIVVTYLWPFKM